jgi:serine protease Do
MKNRLLVLGTCLTFAGLGGYGASRALVFADPQISGVPKELNSYRDIVKHVLPGVVSIEAKPKAQFSKTKLPTGGGSPFDNIPGLPDELRKELERMPKQPFSSPGRAFGSGFIVDPSGVILTNDHVIRGADEVTVILQDGRRFTSRDIKRDPRTDLAVVRIDAKESLPFLKLGDSDAMEIGDRVLAIGAPLGMTGTVTSGIISAKGRDIHMNMYEDFLQTDAAINPGNSGGPLISLDGKVIGINAAIKSKTGGFQGVGLAVASNLCKTVVQALRSDGVVRRGYLGLFARDLTPQLAGQIGLGKLTGVLVDQVYNNTPASKAGIKTGDVITAINGKAVADTQGMQNLVVGLPLKKQTPVTVVRGGKVLTLQVTIEEQPDDFGTRRPDSPQEPQLDAGTEHSRAEGDK